MATWTAEQIKALGVSTDLETGASVWGIGRTTAYELARNGEFPSPVVRVRGRYVVLVAPMMRTLGLESDASSDVPLAVSSPRPLQVVERSADPPAA